MFQKIIPLLTLFGLAIGLLIGILDSFLHYIGFESIKIINIFIFLFLLVGIIVSVITVRNKIAGGFASYAFAFRNSIFVGTIASLTISGLRFIYLKYIAKLDIDVILDKTEQIMLNHYSQYKDELIDNRLSFIEFSYDPVISSIMYFFYYMGIIVIFAFIISFFIRRIDRNISF